MVLWQVPKLDESDDFTKALNPTTELRIPVLAEAQARTMQVGDIVQVERKGYYRCDRTYLGPGRPAVLFFIPDGKVKGLFNLTEKAAKWAARLAAIRS
jgi:glutamyl-tRNA synthetase